MVNLLLVLLGVALNTGAQIALKFAAMQMAGSGGGHLSLRDLWQRPGEFIANPWLWVGLTLYAASVVNWFIVLSRWEVSVAYALMSLAYVVLFVVGIWKFGEPISTLRIAGLILIVAGVVLITRPVPGAIPHG